MAGIQNEPSMQSSTEPDTADTSVHAYKLRKQQRRKQERELRKLFSKQTGSVSKRSLDLHCKQLSASIIKAESALATKNLDDAIPRITRHMVHLGDELTGLGKKINRLKRKVDDMIWKIQIKHWNLGDKQSKDMEVKDEKSEQEVCVLEQNQN